MTSRPIIVRITKQTETGGHERPNGETVVTVRNEGIDRFGAKWTWISEHIHLPNGLAMTGREYAFAPLEKGRQS